MSRILQQKKADEIQITSNQTYIQRNKVQSQRTLTQEKNLVRQMPAQSTSRDNLLSQYILTQELVFCNIYSKYNFIQESSIEEDFNLADEVEEYGCEDVYADGMNFGYHEDHKTASTGYCQEYYQEIDEDDEDLYNNSFPSKM